MNAIKVILRTLTATAVVVTASMTRAVTFGKAMSATSVVTASIQKQVNKIMTATVVAVTASIRRQVNKTLSATAVAVTATLTTLKVKTQLMVATAVVVTATMVKQVSKPLSATAVVVSASMVKQVNKLLRATNVVVTATLASGRLFVRTLTATAVVVSATLSTIFTAAGIPNIPPRTYVSFFLDRRGRGQERRDLWFRQKGDK